MQYWRSSMFNNTAKLIAGVDEVGRGSLIGRVVAAAVILDYSKPILGLSDSKKISEKKRLMLYNDILKKAKSWSIGYAESTEIDEINILNATMLAMTRAINNLSIVPNYVLIDGNKCPNIPIPSKSIVKGDSFIHEISAASIIAKVIRDRQMLELDSIYPMYGFAQHKGYPTVYHIKNLHKYGIIPYYRNSFNPVKKMLNKRTY
ncbi:MAG: ribonuclease HII [Pantoea sp. Brub]|nr:ribonuclease HII [Pantoea sp. Brub]